MSHLPQRIVCLSAESADWLWRIGAWESVVGVTAFFVSPPEAPPKPRISGFSSAHLGNIVQLKPDLVITFSDVQAGLTAALIQQGLPVLATNQRTLAETEITLALLARIVGREAAAAPLLKEFREHLTPVTTSARPRVYFEEWHDPLISGIAWVSELIERAGGEDIFPHLRQHAAAPDRVISPEQVRRANPDLILASWCGQPVDTTAIKNRFEWQHLTAVRKDRVHEIPSSDILQPGYRLIHGYQQLKQLLANA